MKCVISEVSFFLLFSNNFLEMHFFLKPAEGTLVIQKAFGGSILIININNNLSDAEIRTPGQLSELRKLCRLPLETKGCKSHAKGLTNIVMD